MMTMAVGPTVHADQAEEILQNGQADLIALAREFLYNPNRFNVATSRAKALCIVVGSPALFEPECKSPWQMKMANAFCRYRELAKTVAL